MSLVESTILKVIRDAKYHPHGLEENDIATLNTLIKTAEDNDRNNKTVFPDFRGAVYRIPSIAGRPIFETDTGAESQESCPCRIPCRYDWFPVHLCLFKSMAEVQNGADLPRKNER